jgi:archaellum biogenesis protein FlaJ (TadC family)
MSALATGGSSRDLIFEKAMDQDFKTGIYFRQVYMLTKRMGFEYVRAFRMVAKKAGANSVKTLLLRFAGAITAGVSEAGFLAEEVRVEREQYINAYYRSLETLTKWGDGFVMMLTFSKVAVSSFGAYIIYRTAPFEVKTYQFKRGPVLRQQAMRLFYWFVPAGLVLGFIVGLLYGKVFFFLIFGASMLPAGFLSVKENSLIDKIDSEIAVFLRSLGKVTATLGTTVARSLNKIDRRSLSTLEPYLRRLDIRLSKGVDTQRCWDAFRDELGSELANRATKVFVDGITLGGPPEKVGEISGEYAMDTALMRARRAVSAMPFAFLTIPLHFASLRHDRFDGLRIGDHDRVQREDNLGAGGDGVDLWRLGHRRGGFIAVLPGARHGLANHDDHHRPGSHDHLQFPGPKTRHGRAFPERRFFWRHNLHYDRVQPAGHTRDNQQPIGGPGANHVMGPRPARLTAWVTAISQSQ